MKDKSLEALIEKEWEPVVANYIQLDMPEYKGLWLQDADVKEIVYQIAQKYAEMKLEKQITRLEILRDRMHACEEKHPDTHRVSLKEIPALIP